MAIERNFFDFGLRRDNEMKTLPQDPDYSAQILLKQLAHKFSRSGNKVISAVVFVLFLTAPALSQDCKCVEDFDRMVEKVKANYIGYRIKITDRNRADFEKYTAALRKKALNASDDDCVFVLDDWLKYFKDHHLFILENPEFSESELKQMAANAERVQMSEADIKNYLERNLAKLDPIEGLWYSADYDYKLAIIKDPRKKRFIGIVLETKSKTWATGQVKAEFRKMNDGAYKTVLYVDDHSKRNLESSIHKNILLNIGIYGWGKTFPLKKGDENLLDIDDPQSPTLRIIDDKNILISLPSFLNESYRGKLKKLLADNKERILACETLIIDLRGNFGGSRHDLLLAPFVLTGKVKDGEPNLILASADNLAYLKMLKERSGNGVSRMDSIIERMQANPDKIIPYQDEQYYEPETIYPAPKNVAILMDRAVASAAEAFILDARQSKRVTLFGENSLGNIDYQQVGIYRLKCPKGGLLLGYPLYARTRTLPEDAIDYIGIPPNVPIGKNTADKIQFIIDYYAQKNRGNRF